MDTVFCSSCGYTYGIGELPPCPECDTTARTFAKSMTAVVETSSEVAGAQTRPGYRGKVVRFFRRTKRAGASGRRAHEAFSLDRSQPDVTVKTHRVEEQLDDGSWEIVHDERVEYPSKRRWITWPSTTSQVASA